jgi:peroxiredoxin
VVALSSGGDWDDVERTRLELQIGFALVPRPVIEVAEAYGVWNPTKQRALATVIVDKGGTVRFVQDAWQDENNRPSIATTLKVLRGL